MFCFYVGTYLVSANKAGQKYCIDDDDDDDFRLQEDGGRVSDSEDPSPDPEKHNRNR